MDDHALTIDTVKAMQIFILLIVFTVIWQLYNFTYRQKYGNVLEQKIIKVPFDIKCFFKEPRCENGNINGWSVSHLVMYFIIGCLVPNQYLTIVIISIGFELIEIPMGCNAKLIVDPATNLMGYWLGSMMSPVNKN
jgi:hypothetical protein